VAFTADGTLEVVDKPEPTAGPTDVVVAVERCGICGSDLHLKHARLLPPGAVMGHEFGGTVLAAGEQVTNVREGERVAVLPAERCGTCALCTSGRSEICPTQMMTSIGLGFRDGAYAEQVLAAAKSCFPLPDGMTADQAALVEPYAVALHAVRRSAAARAGVSTAAVIGAGPIGLFTLAALRNEGVEAVAIAERSESRAAIADQLGATHVVAEAGRLGTVLGQPPDVVFDCAGVPATAPIALEAVRSGGQVVLVGVVNPGEMLAMPGTLWIVKEVDVLSALAYTDDEFGEAVQAVASGAVDPAQVVSDVRPLDAAEASFTELTQPGGPVKVLLSPTA
jgi:(R,R)-butanediol dehydrogenase/meso-butanediol dehydrogenase/diacetyl reductase